MAVNPGFRRRDLWFGAAALPTLPAVASAQGGDASAQGTGGAREPVLLPPETGRRGRVGAMTIEFKLASSQTGGLLGSAEGMLPPGFMGAPPHRHRGFDEVARVLEGQLTVMVEDEVFEVPAGGWHLRPRGRVHCFWNGGAAPVRFIEQYLPGGHEAYMAELAVLFEGGRRPAPGELAALASRHDIEFFLDRLPEIQRRYRVSL